MRSRDALMNVDGLSRLDLLLIIGPLQTFCRDAVVDKR
jgi:hypothetical protein